MLHPELQTGAQDPTLAAAWDLGLFLPEQPLTPPRRAIVLFSGSCQAEVHLPGALADAGFTVEAVDIEIHDTLHDLADATVTEPILTRIRGGVFDVVTLATPCSTFSILNEPPLRIKRDPEGHQKTDRKTRARLDAANQLVAFTAEAITAADAAGADWMLENPADHGEPGTRWYWPNKAEHASLWDMPSIKSVIAATSAVRRTFAMCAFGAPYQKYTTILFGGRLAQLSAPLDSRVCIHTSTHKVRLNTVDAQGNHTARLAAAYPAALCRELARLARDARLSQRPGDATASTTSTSGEAAGDGEGDDADSRPDLESAVEGGRIADGPGLSSKLAERVDRCRRSAPRHISSRNLLPEHYANLRLAPLPTGITPTYEQHAESGQDNGRRRRLRGAPLPPREPRVQAPSTRRERPRRPIHIEDLFEDGIYDNRIQPWLEKACQAMANLRRGTRAIPPPVEVITQDEQPQWARGTVWDCSDRRNCRPVRPSDASTPVQGSKTIKPHGIRAMAEDLAWEDHDIVSQICDGGIDMRSNCELITVLAFHHRGMCEGVREALDTVDNELAQDWASQPLGHLPFVPCRVLPRNVVLQERTRVVKNSGGKLVAELYNKPRITMDFSYGRSESVNASVEARERAVLLPTVQMLARATGIIATAGSYEPEADRDRTQTRVDAISYVVDCESAYSFCPVQRSQHWQQAFVWATEAGGAGICTYRRLAFGGSFGPQRFERTASLVLAFARKRQMAFDDLHPPPERVRRWMQDRKVAQGRGDLDPDPAQCKPSYAQVYIDDFLGCSLSDLTPTPREVAHVRIDPQPTRMAGGTFPSMDARAVVHAKILIDTLSMAGLHAAPGKVQIGDPVTALGFQISARTGRLDVPLSKRNSLLCAIDEANKAAHEHSRADRRHTDRLLGRLINVAQVMPELSPFLRGGFRVLSATSRARLFTMETIPLARGSTAFVLWTELLEAARYIMRHHDGVPLAPVTEFPSHADGAILSQTDASGYDGFGGFVWLPGDPTTVHWVSEPWPPEIKSARTASDMRRTTRAAQSTRHPLVSMPVAELWAAWMVPRAVMDQLEPTPLEGEQQLKIIAILDCQPTVHALNRATGGEPNMNLSLHAARKLTRFWLAVHVRRGDNRNADALSHPEGIERRITTLLAPGMTAKRARPSREAWHQLLELTRHTAWRHI